MYQEPVGSHLFKYRDRRRADEPERQLDWTDR